MAQVYSHPKAKAVELMVVDALLEADSVRGSSICHVRVQSGAW